MILYKIIKRGDILKALEMY